MAKTSAPQSSPITPAKCRDFRETPPHGALRLTSFSPSLRLILGAPNYYIKPQIHPLPISRSVGNHGCAAQNAVLLAQIIIFSSRKFVKRVHEFSVIFRKNFGVAAALKKGRLCVRFFLSGDILGAHHYRNRRIHLFRQRPLIISRQASILRNHRFLPLQASKNLRLLRANRGLVPTNEVNFAERPLADIHAKLTKLRDNTVIAMRGLRKRK